MYNTAIGSWYAICSLIVFAIAYLLVISEEIIHIKKSKPVLIAGGIIWALVALYAKTNNLDTEVETAFKHNLLEYCELLLFLIVTMSYVTALTELNIFSALQNYLSKKRYNFKQLFWATGFLAFFLSPIVDNLTTVLIMFAIVKSVAKDHNKFIKLSCVNLVIAANAGGVFSPFGDITSLMIWQSANLKFIEFFRLFLPALVSYIIPAAALYYFVPKDKSAIALSDKKIMPGATGAIVLFLITISLAVSARAFLQLPPVFGMMFGLGLLKIYIAYLRVRKKEHLVVEHYEWDTLLFFYGIMLSVGGLASFGYLDVSSKFLYGNLSATVANTILGLASAVIDNIPIVYAVLTMQPDMPTTQWLLITLTAGIGGSVLAIGSAAGVALMGQTKHYNFFSHLKWAPVIILGYFAAIMTHLGLSLL